MGVSVLHTEYIVNAFQIGYNLGTTDDQQITSGDTIPASIARLQEQILSLLNGHLMRRYVWYYNDLTFRSIVSDLWITGVFSGSGASITQGGANANHIGIASLSTGTTAAGSAALISGDTVVHRGATDIIYSETIIRIPTLSDTANAFTIYVGLIAGTTGDPANGCYFRYTHSVNGGRFQCVSRRAGVETAEDSGTAVVAGTWYRLRVHVHSPAGHLATFYINDVQVAQNNTNVPFNVGETFGFGARINKTNGTAARTLDVDAIAFFFQFGTLR